MSPAPPLQLVPIPSPDEARAAARKHISADLATAETDRHRRAAGEGGRFPVLASSLQASRMAPDHHAAVMAQIDDLDAEAERDPSVTAAASEVARLVALRDQAEATAAEYRPLVADAEALYLAVLTSGKDTALAEGAKAKARAELSSAEGRVADLDGLVVAAKKARVAALRTAWTRLRDAMAREFDAQSRQLQSAILQAQIDAINEARRLMHEARVAAGGSPDAVPEVLTAAAAVLLQATPPL